LQHTLNPLVKVSIFGIYSECILNLLIAFTFARVFVNRKTSILYRKAFTTLFKLMSISVEEPITWHFLHGKGFKTIVTDMERAQLKGNISPEYILNIFLNILGFSQYLRSTHETDEPYDWKWYAMRVNIFCHIHFTRALNKAYGTRTERKTAYYAMTELPHCTSKTDYQELCDNLIGKYIHNLFSIHY
jgi:hypothetical protein